MIYRELLAAEALFQSGGAGATRAELMGILDRDCLDRMDYLKLLLADDLDVLERMARRARDLTARYFGKVVLLYAPLYLSDYCTNGCIYCGYSAEVPPFKRRRLEAEEMQAEMEALKRAGFDSILLLTGGDRRRSPVAYIADSVRRAARCFSEVILEVYGLTQEEYGVVRDAGASGLAIYQETYDRGLYEKVHLYGEKRDYLFRLEAPERAIAAGLKHVCIGPLLGLGPAVRDMFMAGIHGDFLQRRYPDVELCLAYPRLRPAGEIADPADSVDDIRFVRFILATRLFLPRVGVSISTRERAGIRDHLVGIGVTRMSAGSKTTVGGYARACSRPGQFHIDDRRSVPDIMTMLQDRGHRPEFCNWIKGIV
ncbi:MAG: 2-iminoacetate synthase ThiH [Syntrophales bacterium]|jgi:2-iminoacetate synthase|nr:2-iminoacetate synthase ThiH [Deltaproteobacteria bacterium]